mgnify:FL=1
MKNFLLLLLFISLSSHAQQTNSIIKGKVTSMNQAVPFASIYLKGGSKGTTASANGNYSLELPQGTYTLIAQSQGYTLAEKSI